MASLGLGLGVYVWGVFRILEPVRFNQNWAVAKVVGIPIVWLVLVITFAVLIDLNEKADFDKMGSETQVIL